MRLPALGLWFVDVLRNEWSCILAALIAIAIRCHSMPLISFHDIFCNKPSVFLRTWIHDNYLEDYFCN